MNWTYDPRPSIKGNKLERVRNHLLVPRIQPPHRVEHIRVRAPEVLVTLYEHGAVDHGRMWTGHVQRCLGRAGREDDGVTGGAFV